MSDQTDYAEIHAQRRAHRAEEQAELAAEISAEWESLDTADSVGEDLAALRAVVARRLALIDKVCDAGIYPPPRLMWYWLVGYTAGVSSYRRSEVER